MQKTIKNEIKKLKTVLHYFFKKADKNLPENKEQCIALIEKLRKIIVETGRIHLLKQPKDGELICPHCGMLGDISDFPDLFYLGISKQYEKQLLLLEEIQKAGFNLVTCGNCGDPFLHRTKNNKV